MFIWFTDKRHAFIIFQALERDSVVLNKIQQKEQHDHTKVLQLKYPDSILVNLVIVKHKLNNIE
jgi:hypothetical protein